MSVKIIMEQIEIGFWDVFILLVYRSALVRWVIPWVYRLLHSLQKHRKAAGQALAVGLLGLAVDILSGTLSQL